MTLTRRYRYRLSPTRAQAELLDLAVDGANTVRDDTLSVLLPLAERGRPLPSPTDLQRLLVTEALRTPEREHLQAVSYNALAHALRQAYGDVLRALRGSDDHLPKPRGARPGRRSATFTRSAAFHVEPAEQGSKRGRVRVPRVGWVRVVWTRDLPSAPSSMTVIREPDGRWFASFVVQVGPATDPPTHPGRVAALDLGLSTLATIAYSDDTPPAKVPAPRAYEQAMAHLARTRRDLASKTPGSARYEKARRRHARAEARVAAVRVEHQRRVAARLTRENAAIVLEDLDVAGLHGDAPHRTRRRRIKDAGWGGLRSSIESAAEARGRAVLLADRYLPSTQTCSECGALTGPRGEEGLAVRVWVCAECGAEHDRDENAARVLLGSVASAGTRSED